MSDLFTYTSRRQKSMRRCQKFPECHSRLCPLDPDLEKWQSLPDAPLCHWYQRASTIQSLYDTPPVVLDHLAAYIACLQKLIVSGRDRAQKFR